jgi:magnesium-transporting ATPase (P-type)
MNILVEYAVVNYNSLLLNHLNLIRNNYYVCLTAYAFIMSGMLMSVSILLSISIDKYIYIFKPYSYQKIITKRRCLLWIIILWLISILVGLLPLLGWNKSKRCSSLKQGLCSTNTCLIHRVFTTGYCSLFATISLLAAIVILYVYVRIFFLARDHLMKIERLRSQCSSSYEQPTTLPTSKKDLRRSFSLSCPTIRMNFFYKKK